MNNLDKDKLERIARQAMNIQIMEAEFQSANSDGEPIEGTERIVCLLYNLENISTKEVEDAMMNGRYMFDDRILMADPARAAKLFPHRGEARRNGLLNSYWRSLGSEGDHIHCECSNCKYTTEAINAVEIGSSSDEYVGVRWNFCPRCGQPMSHEPVYEIDTEKVCTMKAVSRGGRSVNRHRGNDQ